MVMVCCIELEDKYKKVMGIGVPRALELAGSLRIKRSLETSLIPHVFVIMKWIAGLLASRLAVDNFN
jgi:hypothetical protein